jgi:hypothetical protein
LLSKRTPFILWINTNNNRPCKEGINNKIPITKETKQRIKSNIYYILLFCKFSLKIKVSMYREKANKIRIAPVKIYLFRDKLLMKIIIRICLKDLQTRIDIHEVKKNKVI